MTKFLTKLITFMYRGYIYIYINFGEPIFTHELFFVYEKTSFNITINHFTHPEYPFTYYN